MMVNLRGYTFPLFDISLQRDAFKNSGEFVYSEQRPVRIDDDGRQWFHRSLTSPEIVDFLLSDISRYYNIIDRRIADYKKVRNFVEQASLIIENPDKLSASSLADALDLLCAAYILALKSVVIANLAVEDVYERFEKVVHQHLPKQKANRYLATVISCPAAKRALELGFFEDTRGTKCIRDVKSDPVNIFSDTVIYINSDVDNLIVLEIQKKGGNQADFAALRLVAPITIQFCEEFRYADYSIRSHIKKSLSLASNFVEHTADFYDMHYQDVLNFLRKNT